VRSYGDVISSRCSLDSTNENQLRLETHGHPSAEKSRRDGSERNT
jgi:hypothetical protein